MVIICVFILSNLWTRYEKMGIRKYPTMLLLVEGNFRKQRRQLAFICVFALADSSKTSVVVLRRRAHTEIEAHTAATIWRTP